MKKMYQNDLATIKNIKNSALFQTIFGNQIKLHAKLEHRNIQGMC